ncbi:hypothetical protein O181_076593 [Austropuccinia psidii MF-1]|uniref:Uncharacterized protein n=1 Tax=Austropuccinia psidii MF-1 TaxID=1389203 RepID=A0A9Q3FFA9_9BASI|nr:hypothetical protein [Austropuccinia psidii MF-1]
MNQFQRDITHQSPLERPPEEYGQDLGHLRHHWNSVVAQSSDMSDWSNGYLEGTATNRTGQGTMSMRSPRLIQMPPPHSKHHASFEDIRNGAVINRSHQSSPNVEDPLRYISMRPTTLQTIHNQPPLSDHSTRSVSVLGLSQPPFSNQCTRAQSISGEYTSHTVSITQWSQFGSN